jgi:hypothetical protein
MFPACIIDQPHSSLEITLARPTCGAYVKKSQNWANLQGHLVDALGGSTEIRLNIYMTL